MKSRIAVAVILLLGMGSGATWLWAREDAREAIRREVIGQARETSRRLGIPEPLPPIGIEIARSIPAFPGVLVVAYDPTFEGKAPCVGSYALVLWYGFGAKAILPPR